MELRLYLNEDVKSRFADPLEYWKSRQYTYPNLFKIAKKFLAVTGTSVPAERLFSKAGNTLTEKKSRLTKKRLSEFIFLGSVDKENWDL